MNRRQALAAALLTGVLLLSGCAAGPGVTPTVPAPSATSAASVANEAPTVEEVAALPRATYDAVIPGLVPVAGGQSIFPVAYRTDHDLVLYGSPVAARPVAVLPATDFKGDSTTIVRIADRPGWAEILTPARRSLPSKDSAAAAQTAAWIRVGQLITDHELPYLVTIHVTAQTLTITGPGGDTEYPIGVGADGTSTPVGTSYIAARFADPAQSPRPISVLGSHSTAADDPYVPGGNGVVGIHFSENATGTVSHGCIRMDRAGIDALNKLPVGTPVELEK